MQLTIRILSFLSLAGALGIPRLPWRRAAFVAFITLGLCSFPLRAGWPRVALAPQACEGLVDRGLALYSFRNTPHLVLFALCYLLARRQFAGSGRGGHCRAGVSAFAVTLAIGALVELAEGASGAGHCRLRDLLPDTAGALIGWAAAATALAGWTRWRERASVAPREVP